MSRSPVSRRYAQAMLELADAEGSHTTLRADFSTLANTLSAVPEAVALLSNPTVPKTRRKALLAEILSSLMLSGTIASLAKLMLDKGRFGVITDVHASFEEMLDARSGRVTAEVTSATPLDAAAQARIQAALAQRLGKEVLIEARQDPALLGGMVIKVGNTIYDASVSNQLQRLRERLSAGHTA